MISTLTVFVEKLGVPIAPVDVVVVYPAIPDALCGLLQPLGTTSLTAPPSILPTEIKVKVKVTLLPAVTELGVTPMSPEPSGAWVRVIVG